MDLQAIFTAIVSFINDSLLPFIIAISFFFFLWNAVRYFIIGGANPDDQEKARSLAIWGILAFVVISSIWGIVNIFADSFGIDDSSVPTPDYMEYRSGTSNNSGLAPSDP